MHVFHSLKHPLFFFLFNSPIGFWNSCFLRLFKRHVCCLFRYYILHIDLFCSLMACFFLFLHLGVSMAASFELFEVIFVFFSAFSFLGLSLFILCLVFDVWFCIWAFVKFGVLFYFWPLSEEKVVVGWWIMGVDLFHNRERDWDFTWVISLLYFILVLD